MAITDSFVLPEDVLLIPVAELPDTVRDKLTCKEGDLAITRPNVRAPSKIVSANAGELLRRFQTPRTIVAAVLDYSQSTQENPQEVLEGALPLLRHLIDANVLLDANSPQVQIVPTLSPGEVFAGFEIRQIVHMVEDTEVFLARSASDGDVALKVTRPPSRLDFGPMFEREAAVLRHLDGGVSPRLIDAGLFNDRHFLASEWKYGVPVSQVAAELRQAPELADDVERATLAPLHRLVIALVDAYVQLHERGVIHSDVHPSNVLADAAGEVSVVDFGYARFESPAHPLSVAPRAGVGLFFEPECAQAIVAGRQAPQSSPAGEQYSVAAMAFELLTGSSHLDFSPKYDESIRQIAESDPRSWSDLGVDPWPEMEQTLRAALSRDPAHRFPSMRDFADRLRSLRPPTPQTAAASAEHDEPSLVLSAGHVVQAERSSHEPFIQNVLKRFEPDGELFREVIGEGHSLPTASANHGAAGIAYAALRLACHRDDAALLSLGDLWITKTLAEGTDDSAFYNEKLEITKDSVSEISLHHMLSGVYFVRALVSRAMGDPMTEQGAIEAFLHAADGEPECLDITLGRMSVLQGCTMLLEDGGPSRYIDAAPIVAFGDGVLDSIWERINGFPPVADSSELTYQGMAHGWAGILYGTLRWCRVSQKWRGSSNARDIPAAVTTRLAELAECGTPMGRGLVWRWFNARDAKVQEGDPGLMPGWCNGNAGHVHLWTTAHETYADPRYLELATKAAWGMWEQPVNFNNVCCGAAGCAYAMLNMHRHTCDKDWLTRARHYAHRVATHPDRPSDNPGDVHSLYKGDVGLMLLLDEIEDPAFARMPLFE
jgi:serine/threonine-protein kinase